MNVFAVLFAAFGRWFRRNHAWAILCLATLLSACAVGGSSTMPPLYIPKDQVHEVCWQPTNENVANPAAEITDAVEDDGDGSYFIFIDDKGPAISGRHRYAFDWGVRAGALIYKYARSAPIENLRLIPLSQTDAWCTRIPKPRDEAIQRLLDPCASGAAMDDGRSVTKNLLGEAENPSIRSGIFCNQQPQMQWTTQQTITILSRRIAFQQGFDNYYKTSAAFTLATAQMQAVINKSDSWLKRKLTADPRTLEEIQQRATDALNSIEPLPEYGDRDLDNYVLAGAHAGFELGKFDVEEQLFAIDAGVMILEMVAMEVALGPLGGAKFLASAVSKGTRALTAAAVRLEEIPIFLPIANGGLGGSITIGKLINASRRGASLRLANALKLAKITRPDGTDAHHIVALAHRLAAKARDKLAQFGVKLDEAVNGVYLPSNMKSPNPKGSIVHATLANNHTYYKKVEDALMQAKSEKEVLEVLARIRKTLLDGTFYDATLYVSSK